MGCDIHVHIEIRWDGEWMHYAAPTVDEWYDLFAKMSGVRGEGRSVTPIVEPKGFPEDASRITRYDWERMAGDGHTPSWFNEYEIDALQEWLNEQEAICGGKTLRYLLEYGVLNKTYLFGNRLTAFKRYDDMQYVPDGVDAVRLVFWFDN